MGARQSGCLKHSFDNEVGKGGVACIKLRKAVRVVVAVAKLVGWAGGAVPAQDGGAALVLVRQDVAVEEAGARRAGGCSSQAGVQPGSGSRAGR